MRDTLKFVRPCRFFAGRPRAVLLLLSLWLPLLGTPLSAVQAQDGCPKGSVELGREEVDGELTLYCGTARQLEKLKALMGAIETAAQAPGCVGSLSCNFFVGKAAEVLKVPYFDGILTDSSSDGRMANEIYGFVEKAVRSKPSGWRAVSAEEAQRLANTGKFVIGVARNQNPSPTNHGHVVVVAPSAQGQMRHADQQGSGPWVRDSQNPALSVKASKRFGRSVVSPLYAVWEGDKKN